MQTPVYLLISLPLAALLGFAAQRGSICAVRAVEDALKGRPRQALAMLLCSLWVLVATTPLVWLLPQGELAKSLPVTPGLLAGSFLFGAGAVINGGCAISTLTRCAAGHVSHAFTVLGLVGGILLLDVLGRPLDDIDTGLARPSPLGRPDGMAFAAILAALLAAVLLLALVRPRGGWRGLLRRHSWDPLVATTIIGLTGGTLYALHGPWMYTSLLPRAIGLPLAPTAVPAWEIALLLLGVMAGAGVAARLAGRGRLVLEVRTAARCAAGGVLMGAGGALAVGGNDVMVLHTIPALAPQGLAGMAALGAGVLVTLAAFRLARRRRECPDSDSPHRPESDSAPRR